MESQNTFNFNSQFKVDKSWNRFFKNEVEKPYFFYLLKFLQSEYSNETIYPEFKNIFKSFEKVSFNKIKVLLIGQDPYHNGQATGLSFQTLNKETSSLRNIKKELNYEFKIENADINFDKLQKQGVMFLNSILTVKKGKPLSHKNKGWETFFQNFLEYIKKSKKHIVIIALGKNSYSIVKNYSSKNIEIITTSHPSFFSFNEGFYKSNIFKNVNNLLSKNNLTKINWVHD